MGKFQIGDRVKVVDDAKERTTARAYWEAMGRPEGWVYGRGYEVDLHHFQDRVGTVVAVHPEYPDTYAVKTDNGTVIIDGPGLTRVGRKLRFKAGDRVTLRQNEVGTVISPSGLPDWDYRVVWDNGRENRYDDQDLDPAVERPSDTNKDAVIALLKRLGVPFRDNGWFLSLSSEAGGKVNLSDMYGHKVNSIYFNFDSDGYFQELEVV